IERLFGRFAAHDGRAPRAHALDEMLQFELQGFFFLDWHRFTHNAFSSKLTDYRAVLSAKQLFQHGTFLFAISRDAGDETFLRTIIQRDVTDNGPAAKNADFAHLFRTDSAGSQVRDAAVGETQPGVGNVLRFAQDGNANRVDAGQG